MAAKRALEFHSVSLHVCAISTDPGVCMYIQYGNYGCVLLSARIVCLLLDAVFMLVVYNIFLHSVANAVYDKCSV